MAYMRKILQPTKETTTILSNLITLIRKSFKMQWEKVFNNSAQLSPTLRRLPRQYDRIFMADWWKS